MAQEGSQITKDEEEEIIDVNLGTYWNYLKEGKMWLVLLIGIFPVILVWNWIWMF